MLSRGGGYPEGAVSLRTGRLTVAQATTAVTCHNSSARPITGRHRTKNFASLAATVVLVLGAQWPKWHKTRASVSVGLAKLLSPER